MRHDYNKPPTDVDLENWDEHEGQNKCGECLGVKKGALCFTPKAGHKPFNKASTSCYRCIKVNRLCSLNPSSKTYKKAGGSSSSSAPAGPSPGDGENPMSITHGDGDDDDDENGTMSVHMDGVGELQGGVGQFDQDLAASGMPEYHIDGAAAGNNVEKGKQRAVPVVDEYTAEDSGPSAVDATDDRVHPESFAYQTPTNAAMEAVRHRHAHLVGEAVSSGDPTRVPCRIEKYHPYGYGHGYFIYEPLTLAEFTYLCSCIPEFDFHPRLFMPTKGVDGDFYVYQQVARFPPLPGSVAHA